MTTFSNSTRIDLNTGPRALWLRNAAKGSSLHADQEKENICLGVGGIPFHYRER